ncbi:hypothetical protein ABPG74_017474 [Tetrahymena malaccensis]
MNNNNNNNGSYQESNDDDQSDDYEMKQSKNFGKAMLLPVKDHLQKLEDTMNRVQKDLEQSRKDMNNLKTDLAHLKGSQFDGFGDISKFVMHEVERLGNDLRKQGTEDLHDTDFLKMQVNQLLAEKQKLEQTTEILKLRIINTENDVGFRFIYD